MVKKTIKEVEKHIEEFIEYNKSNKEANNQERIEIEEKFGAEITEHNEEIYYATLSGEDEIEFTDGSKETIKWTMDMLSDWGGEEYEVLDSEYPIQGEDVDRDEFMDEFFEEKAKQFMTEYSFCNENYFDNCISFWAEKNYDVEFEGFEMTITGNGYVITNDTNNLDTLSKFVIEEDED
jgi:hypothetical protein